MQFSDVHPTIPEAAKSPENRKTRTQGQKKKGKKTEPQLRVHFTFAQTTQFSQMFLRKLYTKTGVLHGAQVSAPSLKFL
jgi:hypothetical protein